MTNYYSFKSPWKCWLAGCFDAAGRVCSFLWKSRQKPLDIATVKSILVIRLDHIGDVVMSRPAIRALRKKFPLAAIDLVVTEDIAPLFEDSKDVRSVIAAKHGWFNRKASVGQKWSEFWRLVGVLKNATAHTSRHSEQSEESLKQYPSSSSGLRMTDDSSTAVTKIENYDIGIDLRGDIRNILLMALAGVKHTIGYGITGGGFLLSEEIPYDASQHQVQLDLNLLNSFHVAQDNRLQSFEYSSERARKFWQKVGAFLPPALLPRVVVHMGSGYPSKRWPLENFRALIQKIDREALAQIVLIGTEDEKKDTPGLQPKEPQAANLGHPPESGQPEPGSAPTGQAGAPPTCGNDLLLEMLNSERLIDLRGKTELRDLPILLDVCDLFIGNDSGPAHIAAAQGLEILLLASGTNDIRFWHPWTEKLRLLQQDVPCSPCGLEVCPVEGHPCVDEITVDQAYDAFLSILTRLQKRN